MEHLCLLSLIEPDRQFKQQEWQIKTKRQGKLGEVFGFRVLMVESVDDSGWRWRL